MTSHGRPYITRIETAPHTLCALYSVCACVRYSVARNKGIQNGCAEEDSKARPVQSHEVFFFLSFLSFVSFCVSFFFFSPTFPYRMASWWQEPEMREGVKTYSHRPLSPSSLSLTRFSRRFSPVRSVSNGNSTAFDPIMSAFFFLVDNGLRQANVSPNHPRRKGIEILLLFFPPPFSASFFDSSFELG